MSKFTEIFEYLRDELIAWKHKDTMPNVSGEGFNDRNVLDIVGTLPTANVFDFVYIRPPVMANQKLTTGTHNTERSTQTYTIEVFCKRGGTGNSMKRATREALEETTSYIINLFSRLGFTISVTAPDLRYLDDNTARQIITITKTFIS